MNNKDLANLLLPASNYDIEYYEKKYPKRDLPIGAIVTRYAPSPTGFIHMGNLLASFIESKMAKQTNGVFYLRIEDTDQKREVTDGISRIISDLNDYDIKFDECPLNETTEKGIYGPYIQSKRMDIYQTFARYLLQEGKAYPCFCTEEELSEIRKKQEVNKERIGYYGKWARDKNLTSEEIITKINNGEKYVIRLKSPGDFNNRILFSDLIRGQIEMPENDLDIVIIKTEGLPTYHFAHLVDDYLMRTTHIIRADEWLPSLPIHIQLFEMFGFKAPLYAHISPLVKNDNGSRRKLSKRKDPEAAASFYSEKGIPVQAVRLYLVSVANSNFEIWYEQHPNLTIEDFKLDFNKINPSGSLFDLEKLTNISKNYISRLSANEVYALTINYCSKYDKELEHLLLKYKDYSINIFNIEREQKKARKDYACWSDIKSQIWYMYDELFETMDKKYEFHTIEDEVEITNILKIYIENYYDINDDKENWFNKIKLLSSELGYASEVKDFKANPTIYKGHVGDISMVLRVALTTKSMTPDLYDIMKLLGKDKIAKRFSQIYKV